MKAKINIDHFSETEAKDLSVLISLCMAHSIFCEGEILFLLCLKIRINYVNRFKSNNQFNF